MRLILPLFFLVSPLIAQEEDARAHYDVMRYDLELEVDPVAEKLTGSVTVHAEVVADQLEVLQLDLKPEFDVSRVLVDGAELGFVHADDTLMCMFPTPVAKGGRVAVRVDYSGSPKAGERDFSGFHWAKTEDGQPWINTSCQGPGAHSWWPCKASFYHPEDKPDEGITMSITAPAGLYAVSNGRLKGIGYLDDQKRLFQWVHPYPLETYAVTLNVAPYVVVEDELVLEGGVKVPWNYYVLPENAEKAALQFQQVPELLQVYEEAFGPWPFPESKFALVETNFWGMEHSTAVAYGSSYPAWCKANDAEDRYAGRHRFFDYILVHEVAHEWWGNAVSAAKWGHFWIHEGFGTYAEGVYVEKTQGRERADEYFRGNGRRIGKSSRLFRGDNVNSGEAYSGVIYSKGAAVLNTLRHYVDDDEVWWASLRGFNQRFRYGNASTEDFQAVLEEKTGKKWKRFFDEWFYGSGTPALKGTVLADGAKIVVEVANEARSDDTTFLVPLDLTWNESGEKRSTRLWLEPGNTTQVVECEGSVSDLAVAHLYRVLGPHDVTVTKPAE